MFAMFNEFWSMFAMIFSGTKKFAASFDDLGTVANAHTQGMVGDVFADKQDALAKAAAYKEAIDKLAL